MSEVSGYKGGIPNQPQKQVNRSGDIAQTGGVKGSQRVQRAPDNQATTDAQQVAQKLPTIARKMTPRDIVQQLLLVGVRPSNDNRSLALKMVMFGLELSKTNFDTLEQMLKGLNRTPYTEQAAIILTNKGLPSRTAVQQLATFLEQNPKLAEQYAQLGQSGAQLSALLSGQNMLSPTLTAQLTAILTSMQGFVEALPADLRNKILKNKSFDKAELLTNVRALRALVTGVSDQLADQSGELSRPEANSLLSALSNLSAKAKDVADNLIVQAILSRPTSKEDSALPDKFSYWQIPNVMATRPETLELLVQWDKKSKNKIINPRKTKLIIKTETDALGEIAVELDIEDDNVDFRFNTNNDEIRKLITGQAQELAQKLAQQQYNTRSVRVVKRNLDVKSFLIPSLDLNNLTRVQTEV